MTTARQYTIYAYRPNSIRPIFETASYVAARRLADETAAAPGVDYAAVVDDRGLTPYRSGRRA